MVGGVVLATLSVACGDGGGGSASDPSGSTVETYAVGLQQETYVDDSRSTPAHDGDGELPERTLVTDLLYPADGDPASGAAVEGAAPDPTGAPYPLVVFSHGLGGSFEYYQALLEGWAAAGYVVAAPRFPLTYADTPGGTDGADVQQQPGDVSFVIDQLLAASAGDGPLAGLVEPEAIGVAGHSNGAITTLGLAANSCCREPRAEAALVLAGTNAPFADGEYDLAHTPPIFFVHGTEDAQLAYGVAVTMFNEAVGPKGLLTIDGGTHGSWLEDGGLDGVVEASTDFLDAELGDVPEAEDRLAAFDAPAMTLDWVAEEGSTVTIPTLPQPETNRMASATPTTELTNGQLVTVTWEGFLPDGTINIVQCAGDGRTGGSAACDLDDAYILQPNPTGEGSTQVDMVVGVVGTGVCDASHPCTLVINDSALQDEDALIRIPLTFAG